MLKFPVHNLETAPDESRELLKWTVEKFGFIPNLMGVLATSPQAVEAYVMLGSLASSSSLSPTERHVVWFAANNFNRCEYCMTAHSAIATSEEIDPQVIEVARSGGSYQASNLEALRRFTEILLECDGWASQEDVHSFLDAGFSHQTVLDVVLLISHKTLANYVNHIAHTPIDKDFTPFLWRTPQSAEEAK